MPWRVLCTKTVLVTGIWVWIFAYLGIFSRAVLKAASLAVGGSVHSKLGADFFLPNIFGSFAIGYGNRIAPSLPAKWQPVLRGFNTGYCGSCTTFATWQLVVGVQLIEGRVVDSVTLSLITFCTSYMAMLAGIQLGSLVENIYNSANTKPAEGAKNGVHHQDSKRVRDVNDEERRRKSEDGFELGSICSDSMHSGSGKHGHKSTVQYQLPSPTLGNRRQEKLTDPSTWYLLEAIVIVCSMTVGIWLLFIFDQPRRSWYVAMGIGPIGALIRYFLSHYNHHTPNFPLFTFIANITASLCNILIVGVHNAIAPNLDAVSAADFQLWVRSGVSSGIMGSLSTVSTWVNELHKMSNSNHQSSAYRYGLISYAVAQFAVSIIGAVFILALQRPVLLQPCTVLSSTNCTGLV